MEDFKEYIKELTGIEVEELGRPADAIDTLPFFIRESYRFTYAELHRHNVVFVELKSDEMPTPGMLQKQIPKIEAAFGCPVILVFDNMTYYLREKLAHARISFIVPGEYLFIPFMFISLNEQKGIKKIKTEKYSPSTQCIFIYHLWKEPIDGMNFKEVAEMFFYTPRTIGRSARELADSGVCEILGSKAKYLEFKTDRWEVWNIAKTYMQSPIKKRLWTSGFRPPYEGKVCDMEALSFYSNLSGGGGMAYAFFQDNYKRLVREYNLENDMYHEGDIRLEAWSYDPELLAKDQYVDPFSLYMSLQDNPDERVQIALEEMMERVL
ncbi:MAG: hypothetical protein WEA56_05635 [Balneolaceae bacterium]